MPCALEEWTSEDRCMSRDDASCARTAEAGVIPGRHRDESRLPSSRASFSEGLRSMWCARRRHGWARCITERASKPGRRCLTSNIECHINRAAGGCANVFWQRRSGAFPWAPRAIPEPGCGLKRTVRWLMSVVRCGNFKRRCGKSLSTVNRDGERAFVPPSRLEWAGGGSIFRIAIFSFLAQTNGTVLLVNAFYATNGPQTINFAIFVSMNSPIESLTPWSDISMYM